VCGRRYSHHITLRAHIRTHLRGCRLDGRTKGFPTSTNNWMLRKPKLETAPSSSIQRRAFPQLFSDVRRNLHKKTTQFVKSEEPHVCSQCGNGFGRLGDLRMHELRHSGLTPHLCSICGRGFLKRGDLRRHVEVLL